MQKRVYARLKTKAREPGIQMRMRACLDSGFGLSAAPE
jgi:hypothetical protein